ncbi:MAG: hypothetical protein WEF99_06910 [Thermoanaerobaculia bacterium]
MKKASRPPHTALACAAGLLVAAAISAQATAPEFELGYRFVDVSGNEQMYRTQINDRPGLLLRSLHWASTGPLDGVLDDFRIDASDLGAGPAGMLRLSAGRQNLFRLDFSWRRADMYSALPAFANPFIGEGIIPGQHTYNRTRDVYDVTLQILPGKMITPILGYTRNVYQGPGRTTYNLGADEFALDQHVSAKDEEYRIGLAFDAGPVQGAVTQGWRRYRWTDTVLLQSGAGGGNGSGPILGQDVNADEITRTTENKTNTPVTSVWITGRLLSRVKLIGSYVRADASGDTSSVEADAGNFVSFQIARFFSGLEETIESRARTDFWRASARAEVNLLPNVDLTGGWAERRRTLEGTALASSLFIDAVTFGGVPVGDLLEIVRTETSLKRQDTTFDAQILARALGPVAVNAGWSQLQQDVTFGSELSSVLAAGTEPGRYSRTVNTYGGGLTFSQWGFTLGADYRRDKADAPIFRTDFINRDRYKLRAGWSWKDLVRLGGTFRETHANDDVVEIGYSTKLREFLADVEVTLLQGLVTLRASGGEFKADRKILIREPQDFDIVPTAQKEIGHTWEGGLIVAWQRFSLDGAYLWMENGGSIPFTVNRTRVRAEYFVTEHVGLAGEWLWDKYGEQPAFDQAGTLANYNANRYGVFFHWRP